MVDRKRGEKSCPPDGPHAWYWDVLTSQSVCIRCGILSRWVTMHQIQEKANQTARRLLDERGK